MDVDSPLPRALALLLLALPLVFLAGREIAHRCTEDRSLRFALAPEKVPTTLLLPPVIVDLLLRQIGRNAGGGLLLAGTAGVEQLHRRKAFRHALRATHDEHVAARQQRR